jgi:hypothetical protein
MTFEFLKEQREGKQVRAKNATGSRGFPPSRE